MKRQKDVHARWTRKRGKSHYGYRNHINIDKEHKLNRRYAVTDASVHDSQVFDGILDEENSDRSIWADSAYRSAAREEQLQGQGHKSRIYREGSGRRALTKREQESKHRRSKTRARVEHVFSDQRTAQESILVRTKGKVCAALQIGLMNLTYNMRPLEYLLRPQSVWCAG